MGIIRNLGSEIGIIETPLTKEWRSNRQIDPSRKYT
jgi:hypothetical protein